jgi:hypothetical protein
MPQVVKKSVGGAKATWVQVIEDAMDALLKKEDSGTDPVFGGLGGYPNVALSSIYGQPATSGTCHSLEYMAYQAKCVPVIMETSSATGQLLLDHAYAVLV